MLIQNISKAVIQRRYEPPSSESKDIFLKLPSVDDVNDATVVIVSC